MVTNYNPDVLNCLANLSNDEVFTPPALANQVLDLLPQDLFKSADTKFLDPFTKSGVFLREIVKRLDRGLQKAIPDRQQRIDHILHEQVYGIACTELTALLSRRSLYCSKVADGQYSVSKFVDKDGLIIYKALRHTWKNGKCKYCGASQSVFDRDDAAEQYAYQFIHTDNPYIFYNMKFDVVIGNPPYQMSDGGAQASAKPIYQLFVEQALRLEPRYLTMIIPARWYSGGKGLNEFRDNMLRDERISHLVDYFDSTECFPGVDLSGGVCYFLWSQDHSGPCHISSIINGQETHATRFLLEKGDDSFIRFNAAVDIWHKVKAFKEKSFSTIVSSRKPFGIATNEKISSLKEPNSVKCYAYPNNGYISSNKISVNDSAVKEHKVYISYAYGERGSFPYLVIGKPFYGEINSCCSETYLMIGPFSSEVICTHIMEYMRTKFFRFLVLLRKNTQHATSKVYKYAPIQDFTQQWTDEMLYKKYGLSEDEIAFIESMIRPME